MSRAVGTGAPQAAKDAMIDVMSDLTSTVRFDRFSPAHVADPYGLYAGLREAPPFLADAYGVWIVSRYDDVRRVLAEHETFSSDFLIRSPLMPHPGVPEVLAGGHPEVKVLLNQDPPDHAAARAAVVSAFTPRRVRELIPRVQQLTADLVDDFASVGEAELMSAYVMPLPLYVVCELLGLPLIDAPRVRAWIEELSVFNDFTATPARQLAAAHNSVAFENYLAAFLDGHTGDDLTSALLDSGAFDTEQMVSLLITLIFGGHETTANLIGNTLMQLIPPAGDVQRRTGAAEDIAAATEETLRHDPPVQGMYRRVVADTEVGGARIPAGAQVFALIGAAGRDREVFAEPDRWDPYRDAPKHLAFGQGAHYCLGAQLAKMEAKVAVTTLVERLPDLAFAPGFTGEYLPNLMHRGPARLPVRWRRPS